MASGTIRNIGFCKRSADRVGFQREIFDNSMLESPDNRGEQGVRHLMLAILDRAILDLGWYRGNGGKRYIDNLRNKRTLHNARILRPESSAWTNKRKKQWAYRMAQYETAIEAYSEIGAWWGIEPYDGNPPRPEEHISLDAIATALDIPVSRIKKLAMAATEPSLTKKHPMKSIFD